MTKKTIMTAVDIRRTLARIAHEIIERNHSIEQLVLVGMHTRGVPLAQRLAADIEDFEGFRGLLAHGNIHYSKVDPGLKFDWSRLMSCEPIYIPGCLTAFQNAILNSDFRFFNGERYA